jgi:hypothetical protein
MILDAPDHPFSSTLSIGRRESSSSRQSLFCIGGEDGKLRCFSSGADQHLFAFIQEVYLPMNATIRTCSCCNSPPGAKSNGRGVVVAAGGKLRFALWQYDTSSLFLRTTHERLALECVLPFGAFLKEVVQGTVWPKASQDHRILASSSCSFVDIEDCGDGMSARGGVTYMILLCDSRGVAAVLKYLMRDEDIAADYGHIAASAANTSAATAPAPVPRESNMILEEFQASDSPLVSSALLLLSSQSGEIAAFAMGGAADGVMLDPSRLQLMVAFIGDTKGHVSIWLLAGSRLLAG